MGIRKSGNDNKSSPQALSPGVGNNEAWSDIVDNIKSSALVVDIPTMSILKSNRQAASYLQYKATELNKQSLSDILILDNKKTLKSFLARQLDSPSDDSTECSAITKQGMKLPVGITVLSLRHSLQAILIIAPIDKSIKHYDDIEKDVTSDNPNPIIKLNKQNLIIYQNTASERITDHWKRFGGIVFPEELEESLTECRKKNRQQHLVIKAARRSYAFALTPLPSDGSVNIYGSDITERIEHEEKIKQLARYDALTQIPNRNYFNESLTREVSRADKHADKLALLLIDIDNFKTVNDTLGQSIGDQLLVHISTRLQNCLRPEDLLGRIGGDEFAVLMPSLGDEALPTTMAERMIRIFSQPFQIFTHSLEISCSIGISTFPSSGDSANQIMKSADMAMHRAKELGKNTYQLFSEELYQYQYQRLIIEHGLKKAVRQTQFSLLYQPQIDIKSNKIVGLEALIRWIHPEKGEISPEVFIPIAEVTGNINSIGQWVMNTACREYLQYIHPEFPEIKLSLNISPQQLTYKYFLDDLHELISTTQFPSNIMTLELTESTLMSNFQSSEKKLHDLSNMGIKLSIDDFGTGHSSLSRICRLPIESLKIDRSFIHNINDKPEQSIIVSSILELSRNLGIDSILEGVETQDQLEIVQSMGGRYIQGFYFSKPLAIEDVYQVLNSSFLEQK